MKNITKTITSPSKLVMFAIIPAILVLAVGTFTPTADASHCEGSTNHCYGINYYTQDKSGIKFDGKVSNMGPSCAGGSTDIPTVTAWVIFPNGYFIENGFTSGNLAGSCYTTERSYYGYYVGGSVVEIDLAAVSVGSTYTFSMDDINADKTWTVKRDSTTVANGYLGYTVYAEANVGMEGNISNPGSSWIPETEIRDVEEYDSGWQSPSNVGVVEWSNSKGYYHDACTDPYQDFNVGTTSGVNC